MALHAAQGPKLGLPQMISSRVQFGVYGAAIPIVLVCLMYLGFTATGTVLSGQALGQLFGVSDSVGILLSPVSSCWSRCWLSGDPLDRPCCQCHWRDCLCLSVQPFDEPG
jgi:hypothetical protein